MKNYVEKIILKHYGASKIQNIEFLSSGRINHVYKVVLKDCDIDKVVVRLRHFNDPCFGQQFGTEIMVDNILQGQIAYPKLLAYDSSREFIPYEYSILDFIEGELFQLLCSEKDFEKLGQIFKKIHNASVPQKYGVELLSDIDGFYIKRFKSIIHNAKKYDMEVYEMIKDTMKYYYRNIYQSSDISLTHHDFHPRNIIMGDEIVILDWEASRIDATEVDFIRTKYYLLNRASKSKVDAFMRGYGDIHFTDNFFIQEIMWLARISNFEKTFPPTENQKYWYSSAYLNKCLKELIKNYSARGSYKNIDVIVSQ